MEQSDDNAWTGRNIFAHLNDFEEPSAEHILESHKQHNQTCTASPDRQSNSECNDNKNHENDGSSKETGPATAKIEIKIPKLERTINKNYVLQCDEDMTQGFIDYLKEMSLSYGVAADDTGGEVRIWTFLKTWKSSQFLLSRCAEKPTGSFNIKCEYCKETFSTEDFEFHQCDLYADNTFDDRNILKRIRDNNALIATLLKNNSTETADNAANNYSQSKVKELPKNKKKNGPFECTLCDRKFIYESGLTSHMAKHALECPLEPKQLLKHVVKCLKCSRVLCGDNVEKAIEHFVNNHGYSVKPSKAEAETDVRIEIVWGNENFQFKTHDCFFSLHSWNLLLPSAPTVYTNVS